MRTVALPDYRSVPGNLAAYALRREEGEVVHFLMLTLWESMEAISTFAGPEVSAAKYYEFDKEFLQELEPTVQHYEVYVD
jgi:heme-degrading monooxygenase HmoA